MYVIYVSFLSRQCRQSFTKKPSNGHGKCAHRSIPFRSKRILRANKIVPWSSDASHLNRRNDVHRIRIQ